MSHSWGRLPARLLPCRRSVLRLLRPGPLVLGTPQAGGMLEVRFLLLRSSRVRLLKPCWLPQLGGNDPCTSSSTCQPGRAERSSAMQQG